MYYVHYLNYVMITGYYVTAIIIIVYIDITCYCIMVALTTVIQWTK